MTWNSAMARGVRGVCVALLVIVALRGQDTRPAEAGAPIEAGKFRLHKFEQPIGDESYTIEQDGSDLVIRSDFKFTDRGSPVPLRAVLRTTADLTPRAFQTKGKVSRFTPIDDEITIADGKATIREAGESREVKVADRFFTITGYAPVIVQQELLRYVKGHGITGAVETLPGGTVTVEARGVDVVTTDGKKVELFRYVVTGLIWGREAIWADGSDRLVAVVACDAEFDHFEAIREGYVDSLPLFVARAAEDGMAALAKVASTISPAKPGITAITHARLIDGTGAAPLDDAVIVVDHDRIVAVGPASAVKVPADAKVVDVQGNTVIPGLWDMHSHFEQVEWGAIYLAAGVTTVRDCGNEFDYIKTVRDVIAKGEGLGPRLLLAGIVDGDSDVALGIVRANDADQARAVVKRYHDAGFQQIKIYSSATKATVAALCAEAHKVGMTVTGHIPEGMTAVDGIEAGMDQINHVQYVADVMKLRKKKGTTESGPAAFDFDAPDVVRTLELLKSRNIVVDPTLTVFEWSMNTTDNPYSNFEPGVPHVARELFKTLNNSGLPPAFALRGKTKFEQFMATVTAMHKAGITMVAGTDQVVPGYSVYRELELYVKAGFTPMEAIQAATIVPARVMKLDRELGTVQVGKIADLAIIDGDPLRSISEIRNVRSVVTGGRVYASAPLWTSAGFRP